MIVDRNDKGQIKAKYKDEDFIPLCEEYKKNKNAKEIALRENIPLQTMYYYIKKLGYKQSKRLHSLNEEYFKEIDDQDKAYILGFLMADGCVSKTDSTQNATNRLIISLSKKDRCIIEFIKEKLNCSYEIKDYIPRGSYAVNDMSRITINSQKLCKDLAKYGITPSKTGKEKMPELDKEMQRHFIRGFLDGDGYIKNQGRNKKGKTIGFCSTKEMLESILSVFKDNFDIKSVATIRKDGRDKPLYYLEIHHTDDIKNIEEFLYKDANFYLKRKHDKLN